MVGAIKRILRRQILGKTGTISENWYKEEPYVEVSEKRRTELKGKGFLASTDILYDFKKYEEKLYVNNRDYHRLHPFSRSTSRLINNKAYVPCLFSWNQSLLPHISVFVEGGSIIFCLGSKKKADLKNTLLFLLDDYNELFAKIVNGSGGNDTLVLNRKNLEDLLPQLGSRQWLINNRIYNEQFSHDIFGNSVNTLRVNFFKNRSGDMKVFRTFHRFGTCESKTVDNCGKGGMVCSVNHQTGQLSKGAIYGSQYRNGWYSNHVDSGKSLDGTFIPGWKEKMNSINEIVQNLFYLDYGGIDIAPTNEGLKILEINSLPTMLITQLMEPALIDDEFADFLKLKGYHF